MTFILTFGIASKSSIFRPTLRLSSFLKALLSENMLRAVVRTPWFSVVGSCGSP
jgi:hypothetical protein